MRGIERQHHRGDRRDRESETEKGAVCPAVHFEILGHFCAVTRRGVGMDAVAAAAGLILEVCWFAIVGRATADIAVGPDGAETSGSIGLADAAATPPAPSATITTTVRAVNILLTQLYSCPKAGPLSPEAALRSKGVRGLETGRMGGAVTGGIVLMVNGTLSRMPLPHAPPRPAESAEVTLQFPI